MYDKTRLRVFAGPNGSGKTTLFKAFTKRYDPGYFINADEYEQQLTSGSGIIYCHITQSKSLNSRRPHLFVILQTG